MPELFESTRINRLPIKNRFVRSATYEAMAEPDGSGNEQLNSCMAQLAKGEVGLIISGHAYVSLEGQAGPRQLGIYSDALINGLKQMTASVHENGGSIENRARFLMQVYQTVRRQVGSSFPVMVKLNSEDFIENSMTAEEMIHVCRMLEENKIDAIEMSGGTHDSGKFLFARPGTAKSEDREAYYKDTAKLFKKQIKTPLILVGGFLSFHIAQNAVSEGWADYIALSRPLIREPQPVKKWKSGSREKAACISCNKCFATLYSGHGLSCAAQNTL